MIVESTQGLQHSYPIQCADGTMHNAPGMLLSGENISALLRFTGPAFLYDQQNSSREF